MRNRISNNLHVLAVATLAVVTAASARAQLISYDGFNYTSGSQLWGLTAGAGDGGTGWGSTWSATSAAVATNNSVGLSYGGLATVGGGVVLGNPSGSTATTANSQRMLPNSLTNLLGGSGTIWMSFLYQNWSTDNGGLSGFREAKVALFSGATLNGNGTANVNGSERIDIGSPNTYAVGASDTLSLFQGSTFVSSGTATPRGANPANTVFMVLRLDVNNTSAADTAYAWFNPSLASEPSTGTAITFTANDLSGINAIRLQAGNLNGSGTNAVFEADEIRVGYGWADVSPVPEPSFILLAGIGGLALLAWRQKRD